MGAGGKELFFPVVFAGCEDGPDSFIDGARGFERARETANL